MAPTAMSALTLGGTIYDTGPSTWRRVRTPQWNRYEAVGIASTPSVEIVFVPIESAITQVIPIVEEDLTRFGFRVVSEPVELMFTEDLITAPIWQFKRDFEVENGE
jgi:hypothetical protein